MPITEKQPVEFDRESHTYRYDGVVYPSVTQILKGVGLVDTTFLTEEGRVRGSYIAMMTQLHDEGRLRNVRPEMEGYLAAWKSFLDRTGFKIEEIETPHVNLIYGYAGTWDRVGYLGEGRTVVDIKRGQAMPVYPLQTAAYANLPSGVPVGQRCCVHLRVNGSYKMTMHEDWRDWDMFLCALNLYKWKENNGIRTAT